MKNKKNTKNNNKKNYRIISYIFMFALGLILIVISFFFTEQLNNHANVCCGLGTGIITSLLVTIHINAANEKRASATEGAESFSRPFDKCFAHGGDNFRL